MLYSSKTAFRSKLKSRFKATIILPYRPLPEKASGWQRARDYYVSLLQQEGRLIREIR